VTLARQQTTVKPLGGKGAGLARSMAAPQTRINAILNVLASLSIDMSATPIACGAPSLMR